MRRNFVTTKGSISAMMKDANALQKAGDGAAALGILQKILDQNPGHAEALHSMGNTHALLGDAKEAEKFIRKSLEADPNDGLAWHSLATVMRLAKRNKEAIAALKTAHKKAPGNVQILLSLGEVYNGFGEYKNAITALQRADQLAPSKPAILVPYSRALSETGKMNEALALAQIAVNLAPKAIKVLENASAICFKAGKMVPVIECLEQLAALKPEETRYHKDLSKLYEKTHQFQKAYQSFIKLMDSATATSGDFAKAGEYAYYAQHADEAIAYLEKSLDLDAKNANSWTFLGRCRAALGDKAAAREAFQKAVAANPLHINAYFFLSEIGGFAANDPAFATLERLKGNETLGIGDQSAIGFALGRMYHGLKDYDKAFQNFKAGNIASRKYFAPIGYKFNRPELGNSYSLVTSLYAPENRKKLKFKGSKSKKPVFIVGMPRSGTTLLEQIMSAHSEISTAGELPNLTASHLDLLTRTKKLKGRVREAALMDLIDEKAQDIAASFLTSLEERGGGTALIIDKMPQNFVQLGLINVLFPNAKIIHMKRDPMDVGLSIYCNQFAGDWTFAQDLSDIGFYTRKYQALMAAWKKSIDLAIHDVEYEALVNDPEAVARGVIEFCGQEWQPACLEFYKNRGRVFTTSVVQVRSAVNKSAVGKWKAYKKHLGPLKAALAVGTP